MKLENFSRTAIVGWLTAVSGMAEAFGIPFLGAGIEWFLSIFTEDVYAAILVLSGFVMLIMRKITDSPVAEGFKGFIGVKE